MSDRLKKINENLKKEISKYIQEKFPTQGFITVRSVETTRDLKNAIVWVSLFGEEEKSFFDRVKRDRRYLQEYVAKKMTTKNIPIINFKIDHSSDYADNIERILKDVEKGDNS